MKELKIKISDDDYRKLVEIAKMDAQVYSGDVKEQLRINNKYMVESFLDSNCSYWGIE